MTGYLHIITSVMFGGKTSKLINEINKLSVIKKIYVLNHNFDNRYKDNSICSHNNISMKSTLCETLNMNDEELIELRKKYDVIAIDECQFFSDLYDFVLKALDKDFYVIIAGLNSNYKQEPFGDILKLIPYADKVEFLTAFCSICKDGTPGIFTKRIIHNDNEVLIGSEDTYKAVCRKHLNE